MTCRRDSNIHLFHSEDRTYFETKQTVSHYQVAKECLQGEGCTFAGWITSGVQWENFTITS